jgi:uncharacterized protein
MRISTEEANSIKTISCKVFGAGCQVWLFGSRADDSLRGGDIDLYLETSCTDSIAQKKLEMRRELLKVFGDQKIDLVVHQKDLPLKPFHELAKSSGVEL